MPIHYTETERTIHRYIQANLNTVIYMSIREIADATYTSTAAIIRYCQKSGYHGFRDFKSHLKHRIGDADYEMGPEDILDESFLVNFIQNSTQYAYQTLIATTVSLLAQKDIIIFVGLGSSKAIADYGAFFFSAFFSVVKCIDNPRGQAPLNIADDLINRTCIIVCSMSGETQEIIDFLLPWTHRCAIISITNSSKSTIASYSDINIPYYMPVQNTMKTKVASQVPALYTLECLARALKDKKGKHLNHNTSQ